MFYSQRDLIPFRILTLTPELLLSMVDNVSEKTIKVAECRILKGVDCNKAFITLRTVFDAFKLRQSLNGATILPQLSEDGKIRSFFRVSARFTGAETPADPALLDGIQKAKDSQMGRHLPPSCEEYLTGPVINHIKMTPGQIRAEKEIEQQFAKFQRTFRQQYEQLEKMGKLQCYYKKDGQEPVVNNGFPHAALYFTQAEQLYGHPLIHCDSQSTYNAYFSFQANMLGRGAVLIHETEDSINDRSRTLLQHDRRRTHCKLRIEPSGIATSPHCHQPVYAILFATCKEARELGSQAVKDYVKRALYNYAICYKQSVRRVPMVEDGSLVKRVFIEAFPLRKLEEPKGGRKRKEYQRDVQWSTLFQHDHRRNPGFHQDHVRNYVPLEEVYYEPDYQEHYQPFYDPYLHPADYEYFSSACDFTEYLCELPPPEEQPQYYDPQQQQAPPQIFDMSQFPPIDSVQTIRGGAQKRPSGKLGKGTIITCRAQANQ
ncbi:hypothetical protein FGO68_gene13410 [Halteria grandinella]|uniref:Uncharacterized protein n=1 Tax=Halteria grandinella TaxID=5974 RepID=A0A8J8NDZ9_HALGN|nr:hypothetical protein FGO68_gene13410 [Halteria grandinella]